MELLSYSWNLLFPMMLGVVFGVFGYCFCKLLIQNYLNQVVHRWPLFTSMSENQVGWINSALFKFSKLSCLSTRWILWRGAVTEHGKHRYRGYTEGSPEWWESSQDQDRMHFRPCIPIGSHAGEAPPGGDECCPVQLLAWDPWLSPGDTQQSQDCDA